MKWLVNIIITLFLLLGMYWLYAQYYKPAGHYHFKSSKDVEGKYFVFDFKNDTLYSLEENGKTHRPLGRVFPLQKKMVIRICEEEEYFYFYDNDTLKLRYFGEEENNKILYSGVKFDSLNCSKAEHYFGTCTVLVDLPEMSDSTDFFRLDNFQRGIQIGIPKDKETYGDTIRITVDKFHFMVDSLNDVYRYLQRDSIKPALFVYADKKVRIKDVKEYILQIPAEELISWILVFQSQQKQDDLFSKGFRIDEMDWEQIDDNQLLSDYVLQQ